MQLAEYLREHSLTYSEFARRIGTRHARNVERHAKGIQHPNRGMMSAIVLETKGAVTPNDFFALRHCDDGMQVCVDPCSPKAAPAAKTAAAE